MDSHRIVGRRELTPTLLSHQRRVGWRAASRAMLQHMTTSGTKKSASPLFLFDGSSQPRHLVSLLQNLGY